MTLEPAAGPRPRHSCCCSRSRAKCHKTLPWNRLSSAPMTSPASVTSPAWLLLQHSAPVRLSIFTYVKSLLWVKILSFQLPFIPKIFSFKNRSRPICAVFTRALAMVILSVHPSVRRSRPGTDSSTGEIETAGFHRVIA